jgi:hypothetical protein
MADNQNTLRNRPDHERPSYPRLVLVSEAGCRNWLAVFVANPELRKAGFGYVQLNRCKTVSHFYGRRRRCFPNVNSTARNEAVGQGAL